jgi:hypothetical protein
MNQWMQSQPVCQRPPPSHHGSFFWQNALFLSKFLKSNQVSTKLISVNTVSTSRGFLHLSIKEVIQPHLPVRLPCYDFTPVMKPTVDAVLLAVKQTSSGEPHSHGVTGGVYKTRERIHRGMLIRDY